MIPTEYRQDLILMFHTKFLLGYKNTCNELAKFCYWESMGSDVANYLKCCFKCQQKTEVRSMDLVTIPANSPLELIHIKMGCKMFNWWLEKMMR